MADPVSRIFGHGPAAPALPVPPVFIPLPSAVGPDAELIRLAGEAIALNQEITRLGSECARLPRTERDDFGRRYIDPKGARCEFLHRALSRTHPTTREGLVALLAAVLDYSEPGEIEFISPAVWSLLDSLPDLLAAP